MQELVYPKERKTQFDFFFIGMCLLVLCSIFNTSQYGATLSWILIPIVLLLVGRLLTLDFGVRISTLIILLFYAVFCISTALSPLVEIKRDIFTFGILCLAYVSASSYRYSTAQLRMLLNVYVASAVVVSLFILYAWLTKDYYNDWYQRSSFRFLGVYKDPNYVMAYIIPTIFIVIFKIIKNKKQRYLNIMCCAVLVMAMLATGSRSAIVALVGALFVMLLFVKMNARTKMRMLMLLGAVGMVAVVIVLTVIPTHVVERLFSLDSGGRFELWGAALTALKENPLLGGGMNAASMQSSTLVGLDSHNVYLDILCGGGIIGTFVFVLFFVMSCCRSRKQNRGFLYGLAVAFMTPLFFINGFNTVTFYLPLILLTVLSIYCSMEESDLAEIL